MSRSISQDIIDKLESNEITIFHLLEFTINSTTYRYTDCEVPISYAVDGTNVVDFQARQFTFDSINYSNNNIVDSCQIKINNLDSVLTALFVDNVISEEYAVLYSVIFDDDNTIIGVQQLFNGMMNEFNLNEVSLDLTVTSIFTKWNQKSIGRHSSLCRWKKFKGTECTYAGGETACDRTYSRCTELSNTDNFGGFRWIPSIEDKVIWWGPTSSQRREEMGYVV